jgi:hypothetical protein
MQGSRVREEDQLRWCIEPVDELEDESISPELILVSSPEVARRAREQLPVVPSHRRAYDTAGVAHSPVSTVLQETRPVVPAALPETMVNGRRKTRWWAVAVAIVLAAAAAGFVVMQERRGDRGLDVSPQAAEKVGSRIAGALPILATPETVRHRPATAPTRTTPAGTNPATRTTVAPKPTTATPTVEGSAPPPARTVPEAPAKGTTTPPPAVVPRTFVPSRVFAWPPDPTATGYLVRFYRDDAKVYERRVTKPRLTLPASFRFLVGRYRWEVVPIHGSGPDAPSGGPIVESTFVLSAGRGG